MIRCGPVEKPWEKIRATLKVSKMVLLPIPSRYKVISWGRQREGVHKEYTDTYNKCGIENVANESPRVVKGSTYRQDDHKIAHREDV